MRFYALKSDCHGYPIYDAQNYEKLDDCGVCGGNGDTCKDCSGRMGGSTNPLSFYFKKSMNIKIISI